MYDHDKIEKKWQKRWSEEKVYEPDLDGAKKPFYNLMMFPYPSAEGLHVGNMYAFTGADIYGRMKRMQGYDVFEPIGLDGFGIHSENYALKIGTHPADQAKVSEKRFYEQLKSIGNGFAWNEHLETYDPEYYRWTQWIFVQMFKRGLAYRKKQSVNWCPSCLTVLANEQVKQKSSPSERSPVGREILNPKSETSVGVCERCETPVEQREMEQWFFKITDYAERLLKNLDGLDWSEKVKIAQRNWIGKSEGATIRFPIVSRTNAEDAWTSAETSQRKSASSPRESAFLEVFTTRPDTLFGATFMVVSPELAKKWMEVGWQAPKEVQKYVEKSLKTRELDRTDETREKTGVATGVFAINPANKEEIPVWVADYVLGSYGTGAIMAVPAHDERDFEFATRHNLPIREVVSPRTNADGTRTNADKIPRSSVLAPSRVEGSSPRWSAISEAYEGEGVMINSGKFNDLDSEKAKWEITKAVGGERKTQFRLRDWLISRQRYWGPPIPMIFCEHCKKSSENPKSSPFGRSPVGRETRNPKLSKAELENPGWFAVLEEDLPVELPYIKNFRPTGSGTSPLAAEKSFHETKCPKCGGAARRETDVSDTFLDSAWYYLRYLDTANTKAPFDKLRAGAWLPVNMYTGGAEHAVLHLLYVRFVAMALHDWGLIKHEEPFKKFRAHGLLIKDGAKMSKSKGNVINPDEYIKNFGADVLRMYLMFLAPFEEGGDFRDAGILGVERFLNRVWKFFESGVRSPSVAKALAGRQESGKNDSRQSASNPEDIRACPEQGRGVNPLLRLLHKTIKKVTEDIENLHYNTAVSTLMILLNEMEKQSQLSVVSCQLFIKLLAPFAPHMTEEIWREVLGNKTSIHREPWPEYDPKLLVEEKFTLVIQVNGKVRDTIEVNADITEARANELALQNEKVKIFLGGKDPKKLIYVPKKLVNIVV